MAKKKAKQKVTNEKTIGELKETIIEAERDKKDIEKTAKAIGVTQQKKSNIPYGVYIIVFVTLIVMVLGFLERNRVMAMFGGIAFLLSVGYLLLSKRDWG